MGFGRPRGSKGKGRDAEMGRGSAKGAGSCDGDAVGGGAKGNQGPRQAQR